MSNQSYNHVVDSRANAALFVLGHEKLLALFLAFGGLARDLQSVATKGHEAEAHSAMQAEAGRNALAATLTAWALFRAVYKRWRAAMHALRLVRLDLRRIKAPAQAIKTVEGIIRDESEVTLTIVKGKLGKDGKPLKTTKKTRTPEALRAEMAKDYRSLLALLDADKSSNLYAAAIALGERKAVFERSLLKKDLEGVESIAGALAARDAGKTGRNFAVDAEREAVKEQSESWEAVRPLLDMVAESDGTGELRGTLNAARARA